MEYRSRNNINSINGQENVFVQKAKTQALKSTMGLQIAPTKRNVLGEISSNINLQAPSLVGKVRDAVLDKEKKVLRPVTRSYKTVQAKVDTRLTTKVTNATDTTQGEKQKTLRREESTIGHASKAGAITARLRMTKISGIKDASSKENLTVKEVTKAPKIASVKPVIRNEQEKIIVKPFFSKVTIKKDSYSSELLDNVEDIDKGEEKSPILMGVYIKDIYTYLKDLEMLYPIRPFYLDGQTEVTPKMRAMLIDWLVQVHGQFNLLQETLHLTVAIIDRYVQAVKSLKRKQIQLVGITAMFIASKYEEMFAPDIQDFVYITDNTYSKSDILKCEKAILVQLDFSLGRPLPLHFIRRFIKAANKKSRDHALAKYLVDLCLVEYSMSHFRPSELAAAAVCLSISILTNTPSESCWTPTLSFYSGYNYLCISSIIKKIAAIVASAETSRYKAVMQKYSSSRNAKVAFLPELKNVKSLFKLPV